MTTQLTVVERAAVAIGASALEVHLKDLAAKHTDIVAISNKDGREQVHAAAMALRTQRTSIEKLGKAARDDANAFSAAVIAEENRLIGIIQPEEKRLLTLRDEWDEARAKEKREAEERETNRKAHIQAMLDEIRKAGTLTPGDSSASIKADIAAVEALPIGEDDYQEFLPAAERTKTEVLATLNNALAATIRHEEEQARIKAEQEAEAARLAAEREELARLRAEADERQRIADEQAAEARRVEEAKLAEERAAIARQREQQEAENLARQMELDRQAAEIRAQQESARKAQEAAAEAERARIAAAEAEAARQAEAKARAEREEAERIAEAKRAEAASELDRQMKEQAEAARLAREGQIPLRSEVIDVIAGRYNVSADAAERWLVELFAVEVV